MFRTATAALLAWLTATAWCAAQTESDLLVLPSEPVPAVGGNPLLVIPSPAPLTLPPPSPLILPPPPPLSPPGSGSSDGVNMPIRDRIEGTPVTPPPKVWDGNLELGINGTDGNSETLNIRAGGKIRRKTEANEIKAELDYRRTSAGSQETANRGLSEFRWEHFFAESPWTVFSHGNLEYDEFQAWYLRLALDAGVGYRFIKTDATNLTARLGSGSSRKFGGLDQEWKPEAVFGAEFEHKISSREKVSLSTDYRPTFADWHDYHLVTKASWQAMLDSDSHLSLKLSVLDRYDSTPQGRKPNDIDYAITLLWAF